MSSPLLDLLAAVAEATRRRDPARRLAQHFGAEDLVAIRPERTRDIVTFAVDCARDPVGITHERCDVLRAHGLSDAEIIELLAMVSFSLYAINLADAMKLDIDEDFKQILAGGDG